MRMLATPDGKYLWQPSFGTRYLPSDSCLPGRQVCLRVVRPGQWTVRDACHTYPSGRVYGSHLSILFILRDTCLPSCHGEGHTWQPCQPSFSSPCPRPNELETERLRSQ